MALNMNPLDMMRGNMTAPPSSEIDKWFRRWEVVENPMSILDGEFVHPEQLETLKAIRMNGIDG